MKASMNFSLISLAFILISLLIVAAVVTREVHRVWMFSGYMKRVKEDKKVTIYLQSFVGVVANERSAMICLAFYIER